jgi:peptide/nickel transport system substrate-binding protein
MRQRFTRRTFLQTSSAIAGAVALGLGPSAKAARDRVVVRIDRDIQNLDPAFRIGAVESNIGRCVCRRLVMFKPGSFEWENDAAAEISQPDPKRIEFRLKPGMMFHGGFGEMTAEDVKFSFERFSQTGADGKKSSYAKDWAALDQVEVTGTYTGRLHLKNAAPALWLIAIADGSGLIVSRRAYDKLGDKAATQMIGAGPYTMAEWVPGQRILLRADPDYLGPKPHFREVVIRPIQEFKTAELAFRAGEVDFTRLLAANAAEFAKETSGRVVQRDSINYVWVGINVEKPPFDDIRVRRAIRSAIDVDEVLLAAYNGAVGRARALMAPGLLGHWKDAPVYKHDPAAAKKLLAEAGHARGLKARLTLLNRADNKNAALVMQANLKAVGIDLELEVLDGGSFWSMGKGEAGKNLELSLQRFGGKADPSFQTQWFLSEQTGVWNWQRWQNAEFDRLNAIGETTTDTEKRAAAYVQMQQLMDESAAYIWLTHESNVFATKNWLEPSIMPNGDDWQYRYFRET